MTIDFLGKADQYQKNLKKIREYERGIFEDNRRHNFYNQFHPFFEEGKELSRQKSRLEKENRNIVYDLARWLENNSEVEVREVKDYKRLWLHTIQVNPEKPLSLLMDTGGAEQNTSYWKWLQLTL